MNLVVLSFALWALQNQAPNAPQSKVVVTDERIANSPALQAICLSGKGDSEAYRKAAQQLGDYLVSKGIRPGVLFSTTWAAGPDAKSPQVDAQWDVCSESKAPSDGVASPFEFKDVKPQEAAHILCGSALGDLGECFARVIDFVTKNGRTPSAPPRYNMVKDNGPDKPGTYEVWLPITPASPPTPPKN